MKVCSIHDEDSDWRWFANCENSDVPPKKEEEEKDVHTTNQKQGKCGNHRHSVILIW